MKENPNYEKKLNNLKAEENKNIILNKPNIQEDLNSMIYFFSYFKNNNKKMNDEWIELNEKCNNFSKGNIPEMKAILNELKKEGFYDYEQNIKEKNNCFILFNLFNYKKEAFDFLTQKNVEDIELFYDMLDNKESISEVIKKSDISDTINCVKFFKELKQLNEGFKGLINYIKLKLNDKNLLNSFKKYLDNYIYLIEFRENKPSKNFQEINSIIPNLVSFLIKTMKN